MHSTGLNMEGCNAICHGVGGTDLQSTARLYINVIILGFVKN